MDRVGDSEVSRSLPGLSHNEGLTKLERKTSELSLELLSTEEESSGRGSEVSSTTKSPETGYYSLGSFSLDDVKIGLKPGQYAVFVETALELHKPDFEATLSGESRAIFQGLPPHQQRDAVYRWMTDPKRMENNERPRLELRECFGGQGLCANVALACKDAAARERIGKKLQEVSEGLSFVEAGSTTLEISSVGVDKSTPIKYLQRGGNFEKVLEEIGYVPGPTIDARLSRTVIISDGDGTLWDKPETGKPVEATNLFNSAARGPVLSYLAQGGVLVINSGNDPARTVRRFLVGLAGIPERVRHEILSRVIFASAGGGSFAGFVDGKLAELGDYHQFDSKAPGSSKAKLDMLYLGDDVKMAGNDMPAFLASEGHFICVPPAGSEAKAKESGIESRVQYGEVESSHDIFTSVVLQALTNRTARGDGPQLPLFEDMEALLTNTRNVGPATEMVSSTIARLGGRTEVDRIVSEEIDGENPSLMVRSQDVVDAMKALPAPQPGSKMTYGSVLSRVKELEAKDVGDVSEELKTESDEPTAAVDAFLDQTDVVEKSKQGVVTLRILEPGNNDQSTPMYVASQIRHLREEVKRRGGNVENLHIQVLVMGKGGHATTAVFPQIGQMVKSHEGTIFTGTEEAISLSGTLERALKQAGVPAQFVKTFDGSEDIPGGVVIRLEKNSTNTGENVRNALASYHEKIPDHQWVVAATPSSRRQLLTFAHQYQEGGEKCYDQLWGMPMPRGAKFVRESLSDFQVVTEFYAGMAEKARLVGYSMGEKPFIPPFTTDAEEFQRTLDSIYETYATLEGVSVEEAKAKMSIEDLQGYYGRKFSVLEQAIPWSKSTETQEKYVEGAMRTLMGKERNADEVRKALSILGRFKDKEVDDVALKASLERLRAYLGGNRTEGFLTLCRRVNTYYEKSSARFMS